MEFYGEAPDVDLTYSDVFLVPRRSAITSRLDVDLAPGDGTTATLPLVSANMNSVTGARLAATLARRGGLGVLPQDMPLQELDAAIRWVKAQPVAWDTPLVLPPDATVADAARLLTFQANAVEIEVEVAATGATRRLTGQLVPPSAAAVSVRWAEGSLEAQADELGRFTVEAVPAGTVSIAITRPGDLRPVVTSWVSI